ncbi:unnamed protein product [Meganyctiphanes norvegica]|uniref:ShKT domain-containing protein n=1 Tax=Meganyctiphanes norvegica TaxID=48144 RepID=A0AAV2RNW9_MEGNR
MPSGSVQASLVTMKSVIIICVVALTVLSAVVAQDNSFGCIDQVSQCPEWAKDGECENNPVWMRPNCPVSCDLCGMHICACIYLFVYLLYTSEFACNLLR